MSGFEKEFIQDLAIKYANVCEFKSDFPHDWKSVKDGFIEGFETAIRLVESSKISDSDIKQQAKIVSKLEAPYVSTIAYEYFKLGAKWMDDAINKKLKNESKNV